LHARNTKQQGSKHEHEATNNKCKTIDKTRSTKRQWRSQTKVAREKEKKKGRNEEKKDSRPQKKKKRGKKNTKHKTRTNNTKQEQLKTQNNTTQ